MPRAIVTARIPQEQYAEINQLVSDGLFASRSHVLQTFIKLGLEYCDLSLDGDTQRISAEFRARALTTIQNVAVRNMVESIIEELSCFIEMKYQQGIIDDLARIKELAAQLSSPMYQWLMEALGAEVVYQVAQRMAGEEKC